MFTINVEKDDLVNQFPEVKKWVKKIQKMSFSKKGEINESEIEFYCSYGYFVPKSFNGDKYEQVAETTSKMLFDERLNFELGKVRVNLTMKIGHFVISDRLPKGVIPETVVKIVTEVTKVKMMIESDYYQNEEVKNSIPEIDKTFVDIEIVRDVVTNDYKEDKNFDIDSILDKISQKGLDSLSNEEKDFLDNKSKGL
jgi:hypothetical protein